MIINFSCCHNSFQNVFFHLEIVSIVSPRCFQSRLVPICCITEMVNPFDVKAKSKAFANNTDSGEIARNKHSEI